MGRGVALAGGVTVVFITAIVVAEFVAAIVFPGWAVGATVGMVNWADREHPIKPMQIRPQYRKTNPERIEIL